MKVKNNIMAVIIIVIIFSGIGIAKYMGAWKTESSKVPAKYKTGEFKGEYNPEDIRGSYSFKDISSTFNIEIETLAKAFGVENLEGVSNLKVKEFETIYASLAEKGTEIGTGSVKLFVALYKELPYDLTEDTYIPKSAYEILKEKGNLDNDKLEYLEKHSIEVKKEESQSIETVEEDEEEERAIKGKTTFKEVIDYGVSKAEVENIIGGKITSEATTVRDYCEKNNIEFSEIKEKLESKIK